MCDRTEPWTYVDAGIQFTCGVHRDGCAECWGIGAEEDGTVGWDTGAYHYQGEDLPPAQSFVRIDVLRDRSGAPWAPHVCGVLDDGSVLCWGNSEYGMSAPPHDTYVDVAVIAWATWGVRRDGAVDVWGYKAASPPLSSVAAVEGAGGVMVLDEAGQLSLWNTSGSAEFDTPTEQFIAVDLGHVFGCGVTSIGDAVCWELDRPSSWGTTDLTAHAPSGPFVDVCLDWGASACGLRDDGSVTCWSEPYDFVDLSDVPEGHVYSQIACGWRHACAVTVDGLIECWGDDSYGETLVPT